MIISDLNYLESVSEEAVFGGGGFTINSKKFEIIDVKEKVDIDKKIDVDVKLKGNFVDAQAVSQAYGKNTTAETLTFAEVYEGKSSDAASRSVAAAV